MIMISAAARNTLAATLLTLGPAVAESPPSPTAPGAPMRVTTDTAEYCGTLADQVARAEHARRAAATAGQGMARVEELAAEGQQMCDAGLIRGGLVRLRRALMLLQSAK
jgi:hypothetical protein